MTIFYFTATGNSLYVAKKIGGKLISIPQAMKANGPANYTDDEIGIVYPCYAGGMPRILRRFLEKCRFDAEYTFAIMTYGNEHTSALAQLDTFAAAHGVRFDYMNQILMVNNYLPMFSVEEQTTKEAQKNIESSICAVVKDIQDRKAYKPGTGFADKFGGVIFRSGAKKMTDENADVRLIVEKSCTLCGTCAEVCPVDNIAVSDAVHYKHHCEGCLACIHHCPERAIHIMGEKSVGRFRNKNTALAEIIAANA